MSKYTPLTLSGGPYTDVKFLVSIYMDNGNTALLVLDEFTSEPIATATVNVGEQLLGNQLHIKDYSENEGIFDWLIDNQIIEAAPELDSFNGFITARGAVIVDEDLQEQLKIARQQYYEMTS